MRKKVAILLLMTVLGSVSGCASAFPRDRQANSEIEEVKLSQDKEDFLIGISMDEERIRNGKLYDWQKEVLHQYDFAMDYLKRKYPSYTFCMNSCTPKGRDHSWSTFWFCAEGYTKTYDLYLYSDEEGNYSCEDNFYGELLHDRFDEALWQLLSENVPECTKVVSTFYTTQGEKYGESFDEQAILNGEDKLPNNTDIYAVSDSEIQAGRIADDIECLIKTRKIYGSFYIEILSSEPADIPKDHLRAYVQENRNGLLLLEQKFNQFN